MAKAGFRQYLSGPQDYRTHHPMNKPHYMVGMAILKEEGGETSFDAARPETSEQRIMRKAAEERARQALEAFREAVANIPDVLRPSWLAVQYNLAETADWREAITYLRRLVLWRMASGKIEHPRECAAIVMPEGEQPYEEGW